MTQQITQAITQGFSFFLEEQRKFNDDKRKADLRAEAKGKAKDLKDQEKFSDSMDKSLGQFVEVRKKLIESINAQKEAEKVAKENNKKLTKAQLERFKKEQDRLREEKKELVEERRRDREDERIRRGYTEQRIKDFNTQQAKEEKKSKEVKELETKKQAIERMKEDAIDRGIKPEDDKKIKEATIEIRKEEFGLRVKNLEGTALMSAKLEELGNTVKDKGLDPEKNEEYQKESLKVTKALLNERLKNAESKSERRSILKEQKAKDKKALSLTQLQIARFSELGDRLRNAIPETEKIAGGVFSFLGKAALITLLFALPKILNSKFAKDTVEYLEKKGESIKNGFKAIGKFFLAVGKAVLNLIAIVGDFATGDTEAGMTKLKDTFKSIFDPKDPNSLVAKLTVAVGLLALLKVGRLISVLGLLTTGIGNIINRGEKGLKDNKIVDPNKPIPDTPDKTKSKVIGQVKGQNVVKGPGGKMFFADESGKRIQGGKALTKKELKKMKFTGGGREGLLKRLAKNPKLSKLVGAAKRLPILGYILSLGTIASTLMNDQLSGKEKIALVGGEIGGLLSSVALAAFGASILSTVAPGVGTLAGGLIGYFGGKYLITKGLEFLMGIGSPEADIKQDAEEAMGGPSAEGAGNAGMPMGATNRRSRKPRRFSKNPEKVIPAGKITGSQGGSYGDAIMDNASAAANMGVITGGGEVMNNTNVFDQKTINNSQSYHVTENTSSGDTTTASILFVGG
tara:strand:- start:87 stop:2309 length:2223 start_codon:yes stop_codon:yes gene_type:complete